MVTEIKSDHDINDIQISEIRRALPQVLAVLVKNILLLGFGMTMGFPTILIPNLLGNVEGETIVLGEDGISWIGSINFIFVPVGCLISGSITHAIGRRRTMQLVNIPFVLAWLLFHFSNEPWQIYLALCLTGLTGGLLEAPTLTYVAEVTTPQYRGILASTSTQAVILGVLTEFILGSILHWRIVALLSCIAPVTSFLALFFVPESPHWLISKNRLDQALQNLAWLRGWVTPSSVRKEFNELCEFITQETRQRNNNNKKKFIFVPYMEKSFLWALSLVAVTFGLGHYSGMTTLQTYAVQIFATFNAPINKFQATNILGFAEVLGCLVSAVLVHFVGKRKLTFVSLVGSAVCFLFVAQYSYLTQITKLLSSSNNNVNTTSVIISNDITISEKTWIPLLFLILAAFFTHCGIRILPWMLIGEVFSTETRATGSGFSGAIGYLLAFSSNKAFFHLIALMSLPGTLLFYALMSFIGLILLFFILPETEGKNLHAITLHFRGELQLGNRVGVKKGVAAVSCETCHNGVVNEAFDDNYCDKGVARSINEVESRL